MSLSIFSPREDPDKSFEKADSADWTIGAAQAIATNFAPIDSTFDDQGLQPPPMAYWYKIGHSEALLNQVPASAWDYTDNTPSYGDFLVTLRISDESKDIYWIDLDMGFEPEDAPAT